MSPIYHRRQYVHYHFSILYMYRSKISINYTISHLHVSLFSLNMFLVQKYIMYICVLQVKLNNREKCNLMDAFCT